MMSTSERFFTEEEAWRFYTSGKMFLLTYNYVAFDL